MTLCAAGAPQPLLRGVGLSVPPNTLGLVFGRSGSGKTTLLQAIAGLAEPSAGSISFSGPLPRPAAAATAGGPPHLPAAGLALSAEQRMAAAGLVFQVGWGAKGGQGVPGSLLQQACL